MTWTYASDPSASTLAKIRFLCGDTNTNNQMLADEEINYLSGLQSNVFLAAADCCDALASKYAFTVDTSNGALSVSGSQRAEAFRKRAKDLRAQVGRGAQTTFGGESIDANDALDEDDDTIQPSFKIGQDDYP